MKRMKLYEADDKMVSIIRDNYNVLQAMGAFGINLGFGDKTVVEVCNEQRVDTYTFLLVVNYIINGYRHQGPDESVSVPTLIRYLRASHEYFLGFQLPSVRKELEDALHDDVNMQTLILRLYDSYQRSVLTHMRYEEKTLFPYVNDLLLGEKKADYDIVTFSRHHSDTVTMLQELKSILIKYIPANVLTNNKLTAALYHIYDIEEWLQQHANVEEEIFIPAISQLERTVEKQELSSWISDMRRSRSSADTTLSEREKEIIISLVQGLSNKEIADRLFISVNTVMTHRRNIARKLDIHSPAALTIYAIVNNLIDISEVEGKKN